MPGASLLLCQKLEQETKEEDAGCWKVHVGTWVYLFPREAVTKYHKAAVFKKQNLYSLTVLEGRIPKSRCQRGQVPPDGLWEESFCASRRQ